MDTILPSRAVIRGGEREFRAQAGTRPARAVEDDPAAERLDAVLQADQAGAPGEVGAAGAVVADRDAQDVAGDAPTSTSTAEARACLAALVSASATT